MVRTVNQLVGQKMLWGFAGMGHHNGTGKDRFDFIPLNSLMGFKVKNASNVNNMSDSLAVAL